MKKIFSLALMATALLISGQVKADEVTVTTYAQLQSQIEGATGERTINVEQDLTGSSKITIQNGQVITLKLSNDATIKADGEINFMLISHGTLNVIGKGTIEGNCSYDGWKTLITLVGSTNPSAENYSVLNIGENISVSCNNTAIGVMNVDKNNKCSYGVKVNVAGYVYSNAGPISVSGNIQATTGNVPEITISGTAACSLQNFYVPEWEENMDPAVIYAAGYAKWYITGTITGCLPIYAKSGVINITNGTITATEDVEEGGYVTPQPNGSGCTGGQGSAIVLDSKNGYAGNMVLNISGSTTITASENAFALDELTTDATASKTDAVVISGGTINGDVNTTAEVKNDCVLNGTITGGTFSDKTIKDYVGNVNGVIDVKTSGDETVYVVNGMPSGKTWVTTIAAAQTADYVKIAADEEVASDKEIAYLNIPGANKVTVKSGAKLAVGEAVLGADAVIEVEAGAKLVVNGTNGLIAFETTNLVLKAAAGEATGMFVLNPDVKANKQPWATLEYVSEAYSLGEGEYMWEMFTNPFASISTAARNPNQPSIFQHVVDGVFKNFAAWGTEGDVRSAEPFELIAITNTSDEGDQVTYTFTGQLQGSNDAVFSLKAGFNYLGNGYTALMNAKQVILGLQESSKKVRTLLYVWNVESQGWKCYNGYKLDELNNVNPLTAFVLYADEAAEVDMDYEELIWNVNK